MLQLQTVLRAAARLVLSLPGRAPVSVVVHDTLHWLTYPQRVTYKLCLLTYKMSSWSGAGLLVALLHVAHLSVGRSQLRSAEANRLFIPLWTALF